MQPDTVKAHVLYRDTKWRIERLQLAVKEGRQLQESADFARFVINSIAPLLVTMPQGEPLPCDGNLLRGFAESLLSNVQDHWRAGGITPSVELSAVEGLGRKLDLIAGCLAQIATPQDRVSHAPCPVCGHSDERLPQVIDFPREAEAASRTA